MLNGICRAAAVRGQPVNWHWIRLLVFAFDIFNCFSLGASSPLCYKQLGRGWGTSKHNCLVSYLLCWRRHVSATVGHLKVTKMCIEVNYSFPLYTFLCKEENYSFPLYTFLWPEDGPQWPKHVVVSIMNRIQYSCFLTHPTLICNFVICVAQNCTVIF